MQELKRGDIRIVCATGKLGQVTKVESETVQIISDWPQQFETVYYYTLADLEGEKLGCYESLGRFKIEDLDYTDNQKEDMWHESEEHGRQVNEDNHEHYYNR